MKLVTLAEAKAHLSELVAQAEAGEPVCITRRGKPVAHLIPAIGERHPMDVDALRAVTDAMPRQSQTAEGFVREMRDGDRY